MPEHKPSDNVLEETWLAYAFRSSANPERIRAAIDRVGAHYGSTLAEEPLRDESIGAENGLVLWRRRDERLRWPLWSETRPLALACTAVPIGWRSITGDLSPADAPDELVRRLQAQPERVATLNGPLVLGIRNEYENRLVVANDALGIGRLYEMETEDGWVWSNRLGALPVFAGVRPAADDRGWGILAAAGWFLGDSTPIAGTRKVPAGTVIEVRAGEASHRATDERERVLVPPRGRAPDAIAAAATGVSELAAQIGEVWDTRPVIDLSGGRDSRVSAAGALNAGIDAEFKTVDNEPGEVDLVRRLIEAAPRDMAHVVNEPESEEAADDLATRLGAIHLVHDGMRNPQEVRRHTELPHSGWIPPSMSGHGGEIGHGFYYANRRALLRARRHGHDGMLERLMTNARRDHSAAKESGYAAYEAECERVLRTGEGAGIEGPSLLDYFYLAERLPYRSGLGARSGRYSACVAPAFVRAAFDMNPRDRLKNRLHKAVVAELVPEWKRVPFFVEGSAPTKRTRIWEKEEHAAEITRMIDEGRGWPDMFEPDRIRAMWDEVREGRGKGNYEHVFYRLAWRVGYEEHLERLAESSRT
jgi:hypothetical protein